MSNGKIKSKRPNMVAAGNIIAARVSQMISPDNAGSIFDRLKGIVGDRYNSHRNLPASRNNRSARNYSEHIQSALSKQINSETRDDMSRRTGLSLSNLAYAPKVGAGTAVQNKPRTGEQQQAEFSNYQTYGRQQEQTDPAMVDDTGWSKTLAQTVGSGMLSAKQLQAASYANVENMIGHRTAGFNGANSQQLSANEKKEMTFMFQRMILEGYVRGVDIPAMVANMNGGKIKFSTSNDPGLGLGVAGYNIGAMFDKDWWAKASDIDKIGLFYQEVGHAIGVAPHTRGLMEGSDTIFSADATAKANYSKYLDYYFEDVKSESKYDIAASTTDRLSAKDAQALIAKNPDWFSSLTSKVSGTGQGPVAASKSSVASPAATIPTFAAANGGNNQEEEGGEAPDTPTGELSASVSAPTKTFAAGMADISRPNESNNMQDAGSLQSLQGMLRHG